MYDIAAFVGQLVRHEERGGVMQDGSVATRVRLDCCEMFPYVCAALTTSDHSPKRVYDIANGAVTANSRLPEKNTIVMCDNDIEVLSWKRLLHHIAGHQHCSKFTVVTRLYKQRCEYVRGFVTNDSYRCRAAFVYSTGTPALFSLDCRPLRTPPRSVTVVPLKSETETYVFAKRIGAAVYNRRGDYNDPAYRDVVFDPHRDTVVIVDYLNGCCLYEQSVSQSMRYVRRFMSWYSHSNVAVIIMCDKPFFVSSVLDTLDEFYGRRGWQTLSIDSWSTSGWAE